MGPKVTDALVLVPPQQQRGRAAALAPVANRPLLSHLLDSLVRAEIEQVVVASDEAVAPELRAVTEGRNGDGPAVEVRGFRELSLAGALAAGGSPSGRVLIHFADCLGRDLDHHVSSAGPNELDALLLVTEGDSRGGTVHHANGRLAALPGLSSGSEEWSPAGVAVLGAAAADCAAGLAPSPSLDHELVALARRMADAGGRLEARWAGDWLRVRGDSSALLEANRFALQGIRREVPDRALSGRSDVQGAVMVHPSARLESAVVRGPAVIGARAILKDAYVGPYSSIGDDVTIDGAEIEHSIVLPGSRVSHLGNRLEGSVIGPNASVFRDFRLPHALRLNIGDGAEVSVD